MLAGLLVVTAVDPPLVDDAQVVLKMRQQVLTRHDAAEEEVLRHPVGLVAHLVGVGQRRVRKDVDEEPAVVFEPAADLGQQQAVVAHVLEHLDGDDAVEAAAELVCGEIEVDDVAGVDDEVAKAALTRAIGDELTLTVRVGEPDDLAVGITLGQPQRQRAPAAAEVEDAHAVFELRAFGVDGEHRLLGLGQRLAASLVPAAAVLEARPQVRVEERRRHLVVLHVGVLRVDGDRAGAQLGQPVAELGRAQVGPARGGFVEALTHHPAHADAQQPVGDQATLGHLDRGHRGALSVRRERRMHLGAKAGEPDSSGARVTLGRDSGQPRRGGSGMKALVRFM